MSIYPNVTEEDLIKLGNLAEQQMYQRLTEIKNLIWKQTHDKKSEESF